MDLPCSFFPKKQSQENIQVDEMQTIWGSGFPNFQRSYTIQYPQKPKNIKSIENGLTSGVLSINRIAAQRASAPRRNHIPKNISNGKFKIAKPKTEALSKRKIEIVNF